MDTNVVNETRPEAVVGSNLPTPVVEPSELNNPVLERLHALVRRGYRPELGKEPGSDRIVLRHLGRAHDLVLHSDGTLAPLETRVPRHKSRVPFPATFAADDVGEQLRFMRYIDALPRATLRDRTRPWRHKYIYLPIVLTIVVLLHLAFTAMIVG